MGPLEYIQARAQKQSKIIVYPEGEDKRIIQAVSECFKKGIIKKAVLLGREQVIKKNAQECGVLLDGCELIEPSKSDKFDEYVNLFFELKKHKGITIDDAKEYVKKNLFFAVLCVKTGYAHGFVGGSVNTTADTVRAILYIIGLKKGMPTLSSFFIMEVPDCIYGENGLLFFADCAVIIDPSPRQIANITYLTSEAFKKFFDYDPRCALLSYSTQGSAGGEKVDKVRSALEIIKTKYPDIKADGEMQVDTALIPEIASFKMKQSSIAGRANILIFPDLASGNIAYKLTERLAKAKAVGPILTGTASPANDLSRGCSVEDIINVTAITVLQA